MQREAQPLLSTTETSTPVSAAINSTLITINPTTTVETTDSTVTQPTETKSTDKAPVVTQTEIQLNRVILEVYSSEDSYRRELSNLFFICSTKLERIKKTQEEIIKQKVNSGSKVASQLISGKDEKFINMKSLISSEIQLHMQNKNFYLLNNLVEYLGDILTKFKELDAMKERISKVKCMPNQNTENLLTYAEIRTFFDNMITAFSKGGSIDNALSAYICFANQKVAFQKIPDLFFADESTQMLLSLKTTDSSWEAFFSSRLIMPIQRLPRYILLFKEIFKTLPEEEYPLSKRALLISNIDLMCQRVKNAAPKVVKEVEEPSFFQRVTQTLSSVLFSLEGKEIQHSTYEDSKKEKEAKSKSDSQPNSKADPRPKSGSVAEETKSDSKGSQSDSTASPILSEVDETDTEHASASHPSFVEFVDETLAPSATLPLPKTEPKKMPPPVPTNWKRRSSINQETVTESTSTSSVLTQSSGNSITTERKGPPPRPSRASITQTTTAQTIEKSSSFVSGTTPKVTPPVPLTRRGTISVFNSSSSSSSLFSTSPAPQPVSRGSIAEKTAALMTRQASSSALIKLPGATPGRLKANLVSSVGGVFDPSKLKSTGSGLTKK